MKHHWPAGRTEKVPLEHPIRTHLRPHSEVACDIRRPRTFREYHLLPKNRASEAGQSDAGRAQSREVAVLNGRQTVDYRRGF